jgi:hypothetical protein
MAKFKTRGGKPTILTDAPTIDGPLLKVRGGAMGARSTPLTRSGFKSKDSAQEWASKNLNGSAKKVTAKGESKSGNYYIEKSKVESSGWPRRSTWEVIYPQSAIKGE